MTTTIEQLEGQLADQKKLVERAEAAQRLAGNRDFKRIILDEFCVSECARYARESGDPALSAEARADALAMAQAAGHVRRYLSLIMQLAAVAPRNIADLEETLAEVRAEEENGDQVDGEVE